MHEDGDAAKLPPLIRDLDDDDLMEERAGLAGLRFVKRISCERGIPVDRYAFEKQETEVRAGKELYRENQKFGEVVAVDVLARTIDIKKTRKTAEVHPSSVYMWRAPITAKRSRHSWRNANPCLPAASVRLRAIARRARRTPLCGAR